MNRLEERLRDDLTSAAERLAPIEPLHGAALRAEAQVSTRSSRLGASRLGAARSHGGLRVWAAVAAAAVVVAAIGVGITRAALDGVPHSGPVMSQWVPRGDADALATLGPRASAVWEASLLPAAELPHRRVRPLYAAHTDGGDVVVLEGVDATGSHRLAVFGTDVTSRTPYRGRLHLLWDQPTPARSRLLAWDLPRPTPRTSDDRVLVVLAPPGVHEVQWQEQDEPSWHALSTSNGTAALLHATRGLDSFVRVGQHGSGVRIPMTVRTPNHLLSDAEMTHEDDGNCDSDGFCTAGAGSGVLVTPDRGGSSDLRDAVGRNAAQLALEWEEMQGEIELGTQLRNPGFAWTGQGRGSGLLPDGTGLYLEKYSVDGAPERFALYVDRPNLPMGAFWYDKVITGPVPAITVLVPRSGGGRWFAAVAAPLTTVEVEVGDESYVLPHHGDLCYLAIPASGDVKVILRDEDGRLRHVGKVDSTRPLD